MRSIRLNRELDDLVRRAAAREGSSVSEFLRRAAAERAARTLEEHERLEDVIAVVCSDGGRAARSGSAFGELIEDRRRTR